LNQCVLLLLLQEPANLQPLVSTAMFSMLLGSLLLLLRQDPAKLRELVSTAMVCMLFSSRATCTLSVAYCCY
jgi:hypothetical protein